MRKILLGLAIAGLCPLSAGAAEHLHCRIVDEPLLRIAPRAGNTEYTDIFLKLDLEIDFLMVPDGRTWDLNEALNQSPGPDGRGFRNVSLRSRNKFLLAMRPISVVTTQDESRESGCAVETIRTNEFVYKAMASIGPSCVLNKKIKVICTAEGVVSKPECN